MSNGRRRRWRLVVSHGVGLAVGAFVAYQMIRLTGSQTITDFDGSRDPIVDTSDPQHLIWVALIGLTFGALVYIPIYLVLWHVLFWFSDFLFISYSRTDERYARRLRRMLRRRGVKTWMDNRLRTGDAWPEELASRLAQCSGVIIVMTPESLDSTWVRHELDQARKLAKPLIPVLLRGEPHPEIEQRYQYFDARDGRVLRRSEGRLPDASFVKDVVRFTG